MHTVAQDYVVPHAGHDRKLVGITALARFLLFFLQDVRPALRPEKALSVGVSSRGPVSESYNRRV